MQTVNIMASTTNGRARAEGAEGAEGVEGAEGAESVLNVSDVWACEGVVELQVGDDKMWNQGTATLNGGDLIFHNDERIEICRVDVRNCKVRIPKSRRKGREYAIRVNLDDGTNKKYILAPKSRNEWQKWLNCLELWSNKLDNLSFSVGHPKHVMSNLSVGEGKVPVHQIERRTNIAEELSKFERRKREFPFWDCFTSEGFPIWYELREHIKRLEKALEIMNFTRVDSFDFSDETSLVVNITHIRTGTSETLHFNNDAHFGLHTCIGDDGKKYFICQTGTESSFPEQQLSVPNRTLECLKRCLERDALPELELSDDEEDDEENNEEDESDFVLVQRDSGDGSQSDIGENPSSPSSNGEDDESPLVIPEGWEIYMDKDSGNQYYWNEETQESRWVTDGPPS